MSSLHNVFCSSAVELTEIRTKYVHGNRLAALMHVHRLWYTWSSKLNTNVHSNNSLDSLINKSYKCNKCKPSNSHCITPLLHCSVHTPQAAVLSSHIPSLPIVSDGLPCCLQGTRMTVCSDPVPWN